jgi:hypothetical protein
MNAKVNRAAKLTGGVAGALLLLVTPASAEVLFSSDMDTNDGWLVSISEDVAYEFGWDFTQMGIPPSPGGSTTGLMMKANLSFPDWGDAYVIAYPWSMELYDLSGQYTVEFDFWMNANGEFPEGGDGCTEFLGGGVGAPYQGWPALTWPYEMFGASLLITGEGGSTADWRLYKQEQLQWPGSYQYDIDDWNVAIPPYGSEDLREWFPANAPPEYQQSAYSQQTGLVRAGSAGFGWRHMLITVDTEAIGDGYTSDPGIANFAVDGLSIGTVDNSNGGRVVSMSWAVGVIYVDIFGSVSDNPDLTFGVVDNFVVTSLGTNDADGDGVADDADNCPAVPNAGQEDFDADQIGDACDDCPNDPANDADGDGLCADADNCPDTPNVDQLDYDGDSAGDACDLDDDNDGLLDTDEAIIGTDPLNADTDDDLLLDGSESDYGTDPLDADSDDDGLTDGTEVDMAVNGGIGVDPLDPDSDDDGLLDGVEVDLGTMPDNPDTDGDGLNDGVDPTPLDPGAPGSWIEGELRATAETVDFFDLGLIEASNENQAAGRCNALSNKVRAAANAVAADDASNAIDQLQSLLDKIDGDPTPPDWVVDGPQKQELRADVELYIDLLGQT